MRIKKGFCRCGCGGKTKIAEYDNPSRGHKKGMPRPYIKGHNRRLSPDEYKEIGGCWVWQRSKNNKGYGITTSDKKRMYAHRAYYEKYCGKIPMGMQIDHLCRNRACVNPHHLEVVTPSENAKRGLRAKLSWERADQIRQERSKGKFLKDIAKEFTVNIRTVWLIVNDKAWIHP